MNKEEICPLCNMKVMGVAKDEICDRCADVIEFGYPSFPAYSLIEVMLPDAYRYESWNVEN